MIIDPIEKEKLIQLLIKRYNGLCSCTHKSFNNLLYSDLHSLIIKYLNYYVYFEESEEKELFRESLDDDMKIVDEGKASEHLESRIINYLLKERIDSQHLVEVIEGLFKRKSKFLQIREKSFFRSGGMKIGEKMLRLMLKGQVRDVSAVSDTVETDDGNEVSLIDQQTGNDFNAAGFLENGYQTEEIEVLLDKVEKKFVAENSYKVPKGENTGDKKPYLKAIITWVLLIMFNGLKIPIDTIFYFIGKRPFFHRELYERYRTTIEFVKINEAEIAMEYGKIDPQQFSKAKKNFFQGLDPGTKSEFKKLLSLFRDR